LLGQRNREIYNRIDIYTGLGRAKNSNGKLTGDVLGDSQLEDPEEDGRITLR
jgi:hypothetical protein